MEREDTQALEWMRALQQELRKVQRALEWCVRRQLTGDLTDKQFDVFVQHLSRLARRIEESIGDRIEDDAR